jgi:DNA-binding NarL/FixJ family response regulator
MNVMLVEDDTAFRRGFAKLICAEPDFNLMGAATSLAEARRCMSAALPDVLLVDLGLPDGDGIDLIREVYERSRCVNTMVVSVFGDEQHVFRSLEAGATGYLLKDAAPDEIITSIRNLVAGGSPISPVIARKLLTRLLSPMGSPGTAGNAISAPEKAAAPLDHGPFSDREYEILCIIARGFRSDEIARMLSISTHTVISHVKNIYQKLAVHSRAEAVFEARQMGLLD